MSEETQKSQQPVIETNEEGKHLRQLRGARAWAVTLLGAGLCLFSILYLSGFLEIFQIYLYGQIYNAAMLGGFIALTFLIYPATKSQVRAGLAWYDALLIFLGVLPMLYQIIFFRPMVEQAIYNTATPFETILAVALILVVMEAIRRSIGWPMVLVVALFASHPLLSGILPGIFGGVPLKLGTWASMMFTTTQGILGMALTVATTIVIAFVIFGQFLQESGGGKLFIGLALALLGRFRGGPAKGAVFASAMFGTVSGSAVANVVGTGVVTIPLMKRCGYPPHFAGAVEASASNGGQIMPPVMGVVAFIMAELLGMPYVLLCLAAAIPAILYFASVYTAVHLEAIKLNLKGLPPDQVPSAKKTLREGWIFLLPMLVLVIMLIVLMYSPQRSALFAWVSLIVLSFVRKDTRLGPRKILSGLANSGKSLCLVILGCAGAGIILSSLGATGLAVKAGAILVEISGGSMFILLVLTAAVSFLFGMAGSMLAAYIMLVPIVAPVLVKMGAPAVAAHMYLFYWAMAAFISPPVAMAVFAACAIAGSNPWQTGWTAVRLCGTSLFVAFMFVYRPALLAIGSPVEIVLTFIVALIGVVGIAAGLAGYLAKPSSLLQRGLCIIGGAASIWPSWTVNFVGIVILALVVIMQLWLKGRNTREGEPLTG